MEQALTAIWILTAVLIAVYSLLLLSASARFHLSAEIEEEIPPNCNAVSVVIPFRNEANHMRQLLLCLQELDTRGLQVEFLLVNDHSNDHGLELLKVGLNESNLEARVIDLSSAEQGKKAAVKKGIENSRYDLIATLDADCRPAPRWLKSLLQCLSKNNLLMITGPVKYAAAGQTALTAYQQMENAVLMALTQKQFTDGNSILGNGANLCFKKQIFMEAETIRKDGQIAGGDDIFLLEAVAKTHPGKIGFAAMRTAMVETDTEKSWADVFEQRTRWAAKVRFQNKPEGWFWQTGALIFSLLYAGLVLVCAARMNWLPFVLIVVLKMTADALIVRKPAKEMNYEIPLIFQASASFIQPFFILAVGCKARFGKFKWKERLLKA